MNEKFNIEARYLFYLNKVNLKESEMHPTQKKQLRQTFYGAFGIALELLQNDVARIENEDEAILALEDMKNQVSKYFNSL